MVSQAILIAVIIIAVVGWGFAISLLVGQRKLSGELTDAKSAVRKLESTLEMVEEVAEVGTWELNAKTQELTWSDQVFDIHSRPIAKGVPRLDQAVDYYHPDDKEMVNRLVEDAMALGDDYEFQARLIDEKGRTRHVLSRAMVRFENGLVAGVYGAFIELRDTTPKSAT